MKLFNVSGNSGSRGSGYTRTHTNVPDDHSSSLQRHALHPDHPTQHPGPQKPRRSIPGSAHICAAHTLWVLPRYEASSVLGLHSGVCVREAKTSLQNTVWKGQGWLWTASDKVWFPVAGKSPLWSLYHGILRICKSEFDWAGKCWNAESDLCKASKV